MLTFWRGTSRQGIGVGEMVVLDQSYRVIRRIRTANGFRPDLHEFKITPQGTAIIITYPVVRTDLRKVKGARKRARRRLGDPGDRPRHRARRVRVALAREDRAHRDLLRPRARARAVRLRAHQLGQPRRRRRLPDVRAQHVDGLQDRPRDRARSSGAWVASGAPTSSRAAARFAWQHDAHRRGDGAITLFDNEAFPPIRKFSRALALQLDDGAKTAPRSRARSCTRASC